MRYFMSILPPADLKPEDVSQGLMDAMGPWMERHMAARTLISTGGLKDAERHRWPVCRGQGGAGRLCRARGARPRGRHRPGPRIHADAHRKRYSWPGAGTARNRRRGQLLSGCRTWHPPAILPGAPSRGDSLRGYPKPVWATQSALQLHDTCRNDGPSPPAVTPAQAGAHPALVQYRIGILTSWPGPAGSSLPVGSNLMIHTTTR